MTRCSEQHVSATEDHWTEREQVRLITKSHGLTLSDVSMTDRGMSTKKKSTRSSEGTAGPTSMDSGAGSLSLVASADAFSSNELKPAGSAGRRPQRKVTIREALEMVRLHDEEDLSHRQIAQRLDRPTAVVWRTLRSQGVQLRPPHKNIHSQKRLADDVLNETVALHAAGWSTRQIARELGLHNSTVQERLQKAGVVARTKSEAQLVRYRGIGALKAVSGRSGYVPAQPIAKLVAIRVGKDGERELAMQAGVSDRLLRNLRNGAEFMEWTSADKILTALDALWFDAYEEGTGEYAKAAAVWEAA